MMKKTIRTILQYFCIITLLIVCSSRPALAKNQGGDTAVKVGCVDIVNFLRLQDNTPTGYGADYLREISNITGWHYEYVTGSWSQCLQWLREGKIDLLMPAEYSPARAQDFLYSKQECCTDYVMLLADEKRKDLYYEDFDHYHGLVVGMIKENYLNQYFIAFAQKKGFTYRARYYDTGSQLARAMKNNEIDVIVTGNLDVQPYSKIIAKFDYMPAFFITSKNKPELMKQLDNAMYYIQVEKPYFRANLYQKYYSYLGGQSKVFTREEAAYLADAPVLRVVADCDNRPFEWYDEEQKKYRGIDIDIIEKAAANCGLKLKYIKTKNLKESWDLMREGKADLLLGVYLDENLSRNYRVQPTGFYLNKDSVAISRKGEALDLGARHTVALSESLVGTARFLKIYYPQWSVLLYADQENCLKAVADGKADFTLMSILYMQHLPVLENFANLAVMPGISISLLWLLG